MALRLLASNGGRISLICIISTRRNAFVGSWIKGLEYVSQPRRHECADRRESGIPDDLLVRCYVGNVSVEHP